MPRVASVWLGWSQVGVASEKLTIETDSRGPQ